MSNAACSAPSHASHMAGQWALLPCDTSRPVKPMSEGGVPSGASDGLRKEHKVPYGPHRMMLACDCARPSMLAFKNVLRRQGGLTAHWRWSMCVGAWLPACVLWSLKDVGKQGGGKGGRRRLGCARLPAMHSSEAHKCDVMVSAATLAGTQHTKPNATHVQTYLMCGDMPNHWNTQQCRPPKAHLLELKSSHSAAAAPSLRPSMARARAPASAPASHLARLAASLLLGGCTNVQGEEQANGSLSRGRLPTMAHKHSVVEYKQCV